jgi:hypothetical protein
MVEREAVRLGVMYQIGGKWCSFVAVEGGGDGERTETSIINREGGQATKQQVHSPLRARKKAKSAGGMKRFNQRVLTTTQGPKPPPASHSYLSAHHSSGSSNLAVQEGLTDISQQRLRGPSPPIAMAAALMPPPPIDMALLSMYQKEMADAAHMPLPDEDDDDGPDVETKPQSLTLQQKFQRLIALQSFVGFWATSNELLTLMGWEWEVVAKAGSDVAGADFTVTACVIAWIRKEMGERKDSWELLVEKAVAWMEQQAGENAVRESLERAAGLV